LVSEEASQRLEGHLVEPLPVAKQPVFERLLLYYEPLEEIALIKSGRFCRRGGVYLGSPLLKLMHVDPHRVRIERDGLAVYHEGLRTDVT